MTRRKRQSHFLDDAAIGGQREGLFRAALVITLERGFGHVTMDALAKHAGISKGGLLYHFPTKAHLIQAMLAHYAEPNLTCSEQELPVASSGGRDIDPVAVTVLIAAAEDPALLEPQIFRAGIKLTTCAEPVASQRWHILARSLAGRFIS